MRKFSMMPVSAASLVLALCLGAGAAQAQATRTWVSGVGDDASLACDRTAPCKTFAGAISKTAAGGEIDALDPGGFGALTITKSITIDGGGGQVASELVAGTNDVNVSANAGDVVILRNLRINGLGQTANPGLIGINYTSAASLHIENCHIFGFGTAGIKLAANGGELFVRNTTVNDNGTGIWLLPFANEARAELTEVRLDWNTVGLKSDGSGGGAPVAVLTRSTVSENGTGISANGASAYVLLDGNDITLNHVGISNTGATIFTYKNNAFNVNDTDLSGTPLNQGLSVQ